MRMAVLGAGHIGMVGRLGHGVGHAPLAAHTPASAAKDTGQ